MPQKIPEEGNTDLHLAALPQQPVKTITPFSYVEGETSLSQLQLRLFLHHTRKWCLQRDSLQHACRGSANGKIAYKEIRLLQFFFNLYGDGWCEHTERRPSCGQGLVHHIICKYPAVRTLGRSGNGPFPLWLKWKWRWGWIAGGWPFVVWKVEHSWDRAMRGEPGRLLSAECFSTSKRIFTSMIFLPRDAFNV